MLFKALHQGLRRSGFYVGTAIVSAIALVFLRLFSEPGLVSTGVITALVVAYFIAYPMLCLTVNVGLEFRDLKRSRDQSRSYTIE